MSRYVAPPRRTDFSDLEYGLKSDRVRQELPHMSSLLGHEGAVKRLSEFYGITPEYVESLTREISEPA